MLDLYEFQLKKDQKLSVCDLFEPEIVWEIETRR